MNRCNEFKNEFKNLNLSVLVFNMYGGYNIAKKPFDLLLDFFLALRLGRVVSAQVGLEAIFRLIEDDDICGVVVVVLPGAHVADVLGFGNFTEGRVT